MNAAQKPLASIALPARSTLAVASIVQGPMAVLFWAMFLYTSARLHQPQMIPGILSGLVGLGAVVCGVLALREIRRRPELRGRGLAIAGIILGAIPLTTLF